jgi:hypothetical protein
MDANSLNRLDVHMFMRQCATGHTVYSIGGSKGCLLKPFANNAERNAGKRLVLWLGWRKI